MAFKDLVKEAAFQRWVSALKAPKSAISRLRAKIAKLEMTAEELDADYQRIIIENRTKIVSVEAEVVDDTVEPEVKEFKCRQGCGACCCFMSISTPIPGHPNGKPAGVTCFNLTKTWECGLYHTDMMPAICKQFKGDPELCGKTFEEAKKGIIALERKTSQPAKEKDMGKGTVKLFILKKFQDMVDNYKTDIEELITKSGVAAVKVKSHYFYDTSTKSMPWSNLETVIRSSKSGPTLGFFRHDHYVPEEHRSEHTFIMFCCEKGAAYGKAFLVTTLYEHWEIPVVEEIRDEMALRRVLEVGLSTEQPFPELEQAKNKSSKWKVEDGYKDDLTSDEQTFLKELVKGRLSSLQLEALFEQADIPMGFVYTDLSSIGKARLWNILMDSEELGGEAIEPDIRVALHNHGKEPAEDQAVAIS
jgi:uncharacterized protein